MYPTLKNGSIVLMKKYNLKLNYNDIVVIKKNNKIIIKRLVGLPNDTIDIDEYIYVNGKKNDEIPTKDKGNITNRITLRKNEYFVIGDNRDKSIDSRFDEVGIIKEFQIIGKILFK